MSEESKLNLSRHNSLFLVVLLPLSLIIFLFSNANKKKLKIFLFKFLFPNCIVTFSQFFAGAFSFVCVIVSQSLRKICSLNTNRQRKEKGFVSFLKWRGKLLLQSVLPLVKRIDINLLSLFSCSSQIFKKWRKREICIVFQSPYVTSQTKNQMFLDEPRVWQVVGERMFSCFSALRIFAFQFFSKLQFWETVSLRPLPPLLHPISKPFFRAVRV